MRAIAPFDVRRRNAAPTSVADHTLAQLALNPP